MRTKLLALILFTAIFTSCSPEEETQTVYSNTENPEWIRNVYYSEINPDKMIAIERYEMILDLTFEEGEYNQSYYAAFDPGNNYQPIQNYVATDTYISYNIDNLYYNKTLYYTITKVDDDTINVVLSDGVNEYNKGNFSK